MVFRVHTLQSLPQTDYLELLEVYFSLRELSTIDYCKDLKKQSGHIVQKTDILDII